MVSLFWIELTRFYITITDKYAVVINGKCVNDILFDLVEVAFKSLSFMSKTAMAKYALQKPWLTSQLTLRWPVAKQHNKLAVAPFTNMV